MTYAYDHRGRMVTKTLCASASSAPLRDENSSRTSRTLREIKSTTYIWDDWNIIREIVREGDSVAITDNVWGLDIVCRWPVVVEPSERSLHGVLL